MSNVLMVDARRNACWLSRPTLAKLSLTTLIIWSLLPTTNALAKVPLTYLHNLVEQADCIIIGKVVALKDGGISREYGVPVKIANIRPERLLKGSKQKTLVVNFKPSLSEEPSLVLKETYLLFLKHTPSGPEVLVGYLGAQRIKDGSVATTGIQGEPDSQGIDTLVKRIQELTRTTRPSV